MHFPVVFHSVQYTFTDDVVVVGSSSSCCFPIPCFLLPFLRYLFSFVVDERVHVVCMYVCLIRFCPHPHLLQTSSLMHASLFLILSLPPPPSSSVSLHDHDGNSDGDDDEVLVFVSGTTRVEKMGEREK